VHVQAMFTAIIRLHQALGTPWSAATLNRIRATLRAALNLRRSAAWSAGTRPAALSCRQGLEPRTRGLRGLKHRP
jgi:hypothetical protein